MGLLCFCAFMVEMWFFDLLWVVRIVLNWVGLEGLRCVQYDSGCVA